MTWFIRFNPKELIVIPQKEDDDNKIHNSSYSKFSHDPTSLESRSADIQRREEIAYEINGIPSAPHEDELSYLSQNLMDAIVHTFTQKYLAKAAWKMHFLEKFPGKIVINKINNQQKLITLEIIGTQLKTPPTAKSPQGIILEGDVRNPLVRFEATYLISESEEKVKISVLKATAIARDELKPYTSAPRMSLFGNPSIAKNFSSQPLKRPHTNELIKKIKNCFGLFGYLNKTNLQTALLDLCVNANSQKENDFEGLWTFFDEKKCRIIATEIKYMRDQLQGAGNNLNSDLLNENFRKSQILSERLQNMQNSIRNSSGKIIEPCIAFNHNENKLSQIFKNAMHKITEPHQCLQETEQNFRAPSN